MAVAAGLTRQGVYMMMVRLENMGLVEGREDDKGDLFWRRIDGYSPINALPAGMDPRPLARAFDGYTYPIGGTEWQP
jgi:hypothetical protein